LTLLVQQECELTLEGEIRFSFNIHLHKRMG